jgi:hypothetical protein
MRKAGGWTIKNPRQNWKHTMRFFISLMAGIFGFILVAIVIGQFKGALMPALNKYRVAFMGGMAIISFACLLIAKKSFVKELEVAKNSLNPLNEKLNLYSNALVKYIIICDMPVMLGIILFLLTGNFAFLVYAAAFLGFMLIMLPTRRKVAEQLDLTQQEQLELE